jgi:hypothetical protein
MTRDFECTSVGVLILGQLKNALLEGAFDWNVKIKFQEGSGFLSRPLFVSVTGEEKDVDGYCEAVVELADKLMQRGQG